MAVRPRFLDDIAGVAGGAFSVLAGLREELESQMRARVDEAIRGLDLVRREELDVVAELAANARAGQEAAEVRVAALEARVTELEAARRVTAVSTASVGPSPAAPPAPGAEPGTEPV